MAALVGRHDVTTPGLGDQSSIVPIEIFPICNISLPGRRGYGLRTGNVSGQTNIAPAAETVA